MKTTNYKEAKEVINSLNSGNFYCECPCGCGEIKLKDTGLFYLDDFSEEAFQKFKEMEKEFHDRKKDIPASSQRGAKATNFGFEVEQIAPSLQNFPFNKNDCRFIAEPIDYIIFEGLYDKGIVTKIIFSDIKTGKARLQPNQKAIKELVNSKKIEFKPY
jgi:predicted Holliday junction resolvase-like endonuclease